jgi:hypothetical protein
MSVTKQDTMLGFHVPTNTGKTTKHHGNMTVVSQSGSGNPTRFAIFSRFEKVIGSKITRIAFRFDEGEVLMVFNPPTDKGIPFYPVKEAYCCLNNKDLAKHILKTLDIKFEYEKGFYFDIEKNVQLGTMQFWKMTATNAVPLSVKREVKATIDMTKGDALDKVIEEGKQQYIG